MVGLFLSLFYRFNSICITEEGCAALVSDFNSNPSNLVELDLSGNTVTNSGVTEISTLLGNSQCRLHILRFEFGEFKDEQNISVSNIFYSRGKFFTFV